MIVYNKLKNFEGSESEEVMAKYVVNHTMDVLDMSIEQFAAINYVSNSSVVRFCQKIGLKGYSDLKIKLALEINTFLIDNERIEVDMPIAPNSSNAKIATSFLNLYYQTLADVHRSIDLNKLSEIAKILEEANYISLWGNGPSMLIALDFYYKIKRLGYVVQCDDIIGFHSVPIERKRKGEVALIISSYANSPQIRQWVIAHRRNGTQTILITLNEDTPFKNIVDHIIIFNSEEKRTGKLGHFASRTAMSYIIDMLYAMIFNFNYDDNVRILYEDGKTVNERGEYLKNLLIE
ncbi:hypothetical protein AOC36_00435 [Erysipelothrix larvae]|uniref:RpiR family transcriptional regulator n=1 Tax=Erysipelothrix larvae TaxID=1514105 RepID=A0A0X8GY14_9FIRM|nr:MurR/RpiR family transcriptional regulator [Erysipelothrix larvae]AMC92514.1 hypothetical protein AOC36_00435 [Erysipelothrix larvae]